MVCLYYSCPFRTPQQPGTLGPAKVSFQLLGKCKCINKLAFSKGRSCVSQQNEVQEIAMYAVIRAGGKQYRVAPGDVIEIEKLPQTSGENVEFTMFWP